MIALRRRAKGKRRSATDYQLERFNREFAHSGPYCLLTSCRLTSRSASKVSQSGICPFSTLRCVLLSEPSTLMTSEVSPGRHG